MIPGLQRTAEVGDEPRRGVIGDDLERAGLLEQVRRPGDDLERGLDPQRAPGPTVEVEHGRVVGADDQQRRAPDPAPATPPPDRPARRGRRPRRCDLGDRRRRPAPPPRPCSRRSTRSVAPPLGPAGDPLGGGGRDGRRAARTSKRSCPVRRSTASSSGVSRSSSSVASPACLEPGGHRPVAHAVATAPAAVGEDDHARGTVGDHEIAVEGEVTRQRDADGALDSHRHRSTAYGGGRPTSIRGGCA